MASETQTIMTMTCDRCGTVANFKPAQIRVGWARLTGGEFPNPIVPSEAIEDDLCPECYSSFRAWRWPVEPEFKQE